MADSVSGAGTRPQLTGAEIRRLDALSKAAWPALEVEQIDGWSVGASGAYTRRANCVSPVGAGRTLDLASRIEQVESFYAARGRSAVFMLHAAAEPPELDAALEARRYRRASETVVMTRSVVREFASLASLASLARRAAARVGAPVVGSEPAPETLRIEDRVDAAWFAASVEFSRVAAVERSDYRALLDHVATRARLVRFGQLEGPCGITSLALGVVIDDVVSLLQVATGETFRNCGRGRRLLDAMLGEVAASGVREALLSVEANNRQARRLYAKLGFGERYRYWYRAKAN